MMRDHIKPYNYERKKDDFGVATGMNYGAASGGALY